MGATPKLATLPAQAAYKATFNIRKLRFDGAEVDPATTQVWRDHTQPREEEE